MPESYWNIPFPVQNSQRRYPLAASATSQDLSGVFNLPDDFIVGATIPTFVDRYSEPDRFFISEIGSFASGFTISLAYQVSEDVDDFGQTDIRILNVATVWVPRDSHQRNQPYRFDGVGEFSEVSGTITVGRFDSIDKQPAGGFRFLLEGTRFSPDVIRPTVRSVGGLYIGDIEGEAAGPFFGNIEFVPEDNSRITVTQDFDNGIGTTAVSFSAIDGEGLSTACGCETELPENSTPIRRINGIGPSSPEGDFLLLSKNCNTIESREGGLVIDDTCSQPCCGCPELEEVTEDLRALVDNGSILSQFVDSLSSRIEQLDLVVLGSTLREFSCEGELDNGETSFRY